MSIEDCLLARLAYEVARNRENRLSSRIPAWIPRVQISSGGAGRKPKFAYTEEEIEATLGQYRDFSPGWMRDALEAQYHRAMTEFRAQKSAYDLALEASGYAAAERALKAAAREVDRLSANLQ